MLIHSFADEHLGCFRVLAIVNSAAMTSAMKRCMKQGTQSWCSRTTQRGGGWGGRWEGGSGWGNTGAPVGDSCRCVAKPPQYYNEIILQLKVINFKKCFSDFCDML